MPEKAPTNEPNPFLDQNGVEQPFSKEGVLNRNFGKDVTVPSEAGIYANGVLNRSKMYRERGGVSPDTPDTNEASDEHVDIAGIESELPSEALSVQEEAQPPIPESGVETSVVKEKKPLMTELVDTYRALKIEDPEKAAFNALFERLDPNLTDEEKLEKMRGITAEYRSHLEGQKEK